MTNAQKQNDVARTDRLIRKTGTAPAPTRRRIMSGFGGLVGVGLPAQLAASGEARAAANASSGGAVVPLAPSVGSIFAGLPTECMGVPQVTADRTVNGLRLSARYGTELVASLMLSENRQVFSTPQGTFDSVIKTSRPNPNTIVHTLTAFDVALGTQSVLRIRGHITREGVERIAFRVNFVETAEFSTSDSSDRILEEFAKVRSALSNTSLPLNLLALNTFAGWAPPLDEFPNYIVNIHLLTASVGLSPVLSAAAHQEPGESPLGRWLKCLMDCCDDCGGCWDDNGLFGHVGCHRCRGTGIFEGLKQGGCYNLCVILCVPDAVVGPLKP